MKPLAKLLAIVALLISVAAGTPVSLEAQPSAPGACCVQQFASCAASCPCGVASYSCTLDYPGCIGFCTCNACP